MAPMPGEVSPQRLAEAGLGWPLYEDERTIENLTLLDGERAHIVLAGLAKTIELRDRLLGPASNEEKARWLPNAAGAVLLGQELRPERRRLQMLQGIERYRADYAAGLRQTELRRQQLTVTDRFHDFVTDRRGPVNGFERACSFIMPTGMGKTAVLVSITEMLKYAEDPNDPIRVLIIEPDVDLIGQTIRKGFGRFGWPGADIGAFHGKLKQGDRQIVLITDESFNIQAERGTLGDFDAVLGNEGHILLGPKRLTNLQEYCANRLLVLTTATPDRDEERSIRDIAAPIFEMSLRDALNEPEEDRWVAPLQCMTVKAPVTPDIVGYIKERFKGTKLTTEELGWWVQREASMRTSLKFAKTMVEGGIQALMKCAPGDDLAEAREAAARLNDIDIIDPRTGESRKIVAEVVSGDMSPEERGVIYDRFNDGKVDVLTFCRVLIMGWDSPRAKGIIDNYPIGSLVDAGQSLGRITRIYIDEDGNEVVGLAVTVWDETAPRDFITYAQVLGETVNDPDKIFGARQEDGVAVPQPRDPVQGEQRRGLHMTSLPDDLRGLANEFSRVSLKDISQKLLSDNGSLNAPEILDERANRMITLDRASAILKLSRAEFIELVKKYDLGLKQSRKTQVFYVRQGDLATIVTHEELQFQRLPNKGYHSVADAAKALGRTLKEMDEFIQERQKSVITFVDEANVPDRYISEEAFDSLRRSNVHQRRRERYAADDRES